MLQMVKLNDQRVSKLSQGCTSMETRFESKISGLFQKFQSLKHFANCLEISCTSPNN